MPDTGDKLETRLNQSPPGTVRLMALPRPVSALRGQSAPRGLPSHSLTRLPLTECWVEQKAALDRAGCAFAGPAPAHAA